MGMFDYVSIDLAMLPITDEERQDIGEENSDFQTKSFQDRWMRTYDITPSIENRCQLFVTDGYMEHEKGPGIICREMEPVLLTGDIHFYTLGDSNAEYDFIATFDNGKLMKIERGIVSLLD